VVRDVIPRRAAEVCPARGENPSQADSGDKCNHARMHLLQELRRGGWSFLPELCVSPLLEILSLPEVRRSYRLMYCFPFQRKAPE
jgi:hypothetical protein